MVQEDIIKSNFLNKKTSTLCLVTKLFHFILRYFIFLIWNFAKLWELVFFEELRDSFIILFLVLPPEFLIARFGCVHCFHIHTNCCLTMSLKCFYCKIIFFTHCTSQLHLLNSILEI